MFVQNQVSEEFYVTFLALKIYLSILLLIGWSVLAYGQSWTGVYQFNKGNNKPQGALYLNQYRPDSAFFYLTFISGEPEFNSFMLKGFMSIETLRATYRGTDSTFLYCTSSPKSIVFKSDSCVVQERGILAKYNKTSGVLKKNSTFYVDFVERGAKVKSDSTVVYAVPSETAPVACMIGKSTSVKIIDSYESFYLIELADRMKDFLWVPKRHLIPMKVK